MISYLLIKLIPLGTPVVPLEKGMTTVSCIGWIELFILKRLPSSFISSLKEVNPSTSPKTRRSFNGLDIN